jgi:hypothetical protein
VIYTPAAQYGRIGFEASAWIRQIAEQSHEERDVKRRRCGPGRDAAALTCYKRDATTGQKAEQ